jgi:glycoside/pentoside/hexuronide:cation symporter, GPH family
MRGMASRLTRGRRIGYAAGSLGTGGFSTVPGLLLLYYLTDTLGVPAAAAGALVLAPKIVDVVLNPVLGSLSDRTMLRRGSRSVWLLAGGIALPLAFAATFAAPAAFTDGAAAAWVGGWFLVSVIAFAVFQVTYLVLPAEITDDPAERTDLMSWRIVLLTVAILGSGVAAPLLVRAAGDGRAGYAVMGVAVGAVLLVATLTAWAATRALPAWSAPEREPNLAERMAAVRENRPFAVLLGAFVLQALATGTMLAAIAYVTTHVLADEGLTSALFVAFVGPAAVVVPAWRLAAGRWGKRACFLLSSALFTVAAVGLAAVAVVPVPVVLAVVAVAGVGYAGMQLFPLAMLPDTIAADGARSGRQRAGVFTGVWTAGETAGFALGPGVVGLVLAATGFVSSSGGDVVQPASARAGVVTVFAVVPALLVAASLPLIRRYRLVEVPPPAGLPEGTTHR